MKAAARRGRAVLLVAPVMLLLGLLACDATDPPTPPTEERIDLEGLWLVEPDSGTDYGSGGVTTLEFGSAPSGTATFLSRSSANDITACERHVYSALTANVVLLDGDHYQAEASGANRIELFNESAAITLTRVAGPAPVAPCTQATAVELERFAFGVGGFSTLDAFQSRLYFNTDQAGAPLVAYDTATSGLGPARTYTGFHDHVVAARSDSEFYGHCACGNITSLERFDIDAGTALATIDSGTALGLFLSLERGVYTGGSVIVSGRDYERSGVNVVVSLDPDTLALQSQREVLPQAFVRDLTWTGAGLAALVGGAIVVIGADGKADATIQVNGPLSAPRGLAVIGSSFYLLDETELDEAVLYEVRMP